MNGNNLIGIAIIIVGILFNVYASNVLTDYNKVSQYIEDNNLKYDEQKIIRRKYKGRRDITMLVFGTLMLIAAVLVPNPNIKVGLGVAGIFTIFYSAIINWDRFDDKYRLFIVSFTLGFLCYAGIRVMK